MRIARRSWPALLLAAPALAAAPAWVTTLRSGGFVLYMRHTITDRSQVDTGRLGDRAGQRNLSAAGIAQAQALSDAMARLRIPLRPIRASPVFRASDTAAIMARGAPVDVTMELVADDYAADVPGAIASARRAMGTPPPAGSNALLVGHIHVFGPAIFGRMLAQAEFPEGAFGMVAPEPAGPRVVQVIMPEAVIAAAQT
ncbi:histidine phosphatase family protein [Roseomonas rosulenta]|uniref:histidine phosphatase family protein n=1 Tax=Roseomonas rosulenta TaxID=2748667 RepID=UPI0018DFF564|nr:histidine phosphatase family protein [Roseomonas rosulenta]